jgi:hypothetical protein
VRRFSRVLIVWLATKSDAGSNQWGETARA